MWRGRGRWWVVSALAVQVLAATLPLAVVLTVPGSARAYTPHAPILIVGDGNFTPANGVLGGSGTPADPYVISGWEINTTWLPRGIEIRNTTSSFVIRDVLVYSSYTPPVISGQDGIYLVNVSSGRVENVTVSNERSGIRIEDSSYMTLQGNTLSSNNQAGIILYYSLNATVSGNRLFDDGVKMNGDDPAHFNSHTVMPDNLVNNRPLAFYKDCNGLDVNGTALGQLIVVTCSSVRVANLHITNADVAVQMAYVADAVIEDSNLSFNSSGLGLINTTRVAVVRNQFFQDYYGAYVGSSNNLTFSGNFVSHDNFGLYALSSTGFLVTHNRFNVNLAEVGFGRVTNSTVVRNDFAGNGLTPTLGVAMGDQSSGVRVHHNNFLNNPPPQARDDGAMEDAWDDGYPAGGNYWSDYAGADQCSGPAQNVCTGSDGIGDTPHAIDADTRDRYPLTSPVRWNMPPIVAVLSPIGGEDWSGGAPKAVGWTVTDDEDPPSEITLDLLYSPDGGQSWTTIARGLPGSVGSHVWRLPRIDSDAVLLRACATNRRNLTGCTTTASFRIDSSPPIVLSTTPADGATGITTTREILIVFDEAVNRSSAEGAVSIRPDPGGASFRWTEDAGRPVLVIGHAPFRPDTEVVVALSTSLRDVSDPGNSPAQPIVFRFRTGTETSPFLLGLGGAAAVAGALAIWEPSRVAMMTTLLGMAYRARRKGEEDKETRGMIRGYLRVHPGDTYADIKRNLDLNNGALTWHLKKLEDEGVIKSKVMGARKRYFPKEATVPVENGGELHYLQQRLLRAVAGEPGSPVAVLAAALGTTKQVTLYHLRSLSVKGLVRLERRGLGLRAFPPARPSSDRGAPEGAPAEDVKRE